jgi:DNA-directed RNA polymerase specialized sigma24 family protein
MIQFQLTGGDAACRALMARYQAGDGQAFEAIYAALGPCVRAYLSKLALLNGTGHARVEDVFLAIHHARRSYNPRARFEPWITAVVHHAARPPRRARGGAFLEAVRACVTR